LRILRRSINRPLGAFYRNSWAPPRRGLRREVTQSSTGDFGAVDRISGNLGWSRNSAAECFHDGSGRPQNPRAVRTPLPHLRPRGPRYGQPPVFSHGGRLPGLGKWGLLWRGSSGGLAGERVAPGGRWNAAHDRGRALGSVRSEEGQRVSKGYGPGWRNHRKCTRNRLKTLKRTRELRRSGMLIPSSSRSPVHNYERECLRPQGASQPCQAGF